MARETDGRLPFQNKLSSVIEGLEKHPRFGELTDYVLKKALSQFESRETYNNLHSPETSLAYFTLTGNSIAAAEALRTIADNNNKGGNEWLRAISIISVATETRLLCEKLNSVGVPPIDHILGSKLSTSR